MSDYRPIGVGRGRTGVLSLGALDSWRTHEWNRHQREVSVDSRIVRFVDRGTGPCIVLVHGQGGCWQWWLRVIPDLATDHRVIAIDLAGFGGSQTADTNVFDAQMATVMGVLDACHIAKATLVGHSMGGLVALATAAAHPHRISTLILVDAGGGSISASRLTLILRTFSIVNKALQWSWFTRLIIAAPHLRRAAFALAVHDRAVITRSIATEIVPRLGSPGFITNMRAAADALKTISPQNVRCPTLVLWGADDRVLPVKTGVSLAASIPDATFDVIEGVGHCVMLEAPGAFVTAVEAFACTANEAPRLARLNDEPETPGASADR